MGSVRGVDERTGKFCPRCGFEFYPIMSKHYFGEWGRATALPAVRQDL